MAMFDNIGRKLGDLAQNAAKKSSEMVEVTKLNINIKSEEDSINQLFSEIGKYCLIKYEAGNENDNSIIELCEKIKGNKANINILKDKINEIKNVAVCEKCGSEVLRTSTFCGSCGAKVVFEEKEDSSDVQDNSVLCPNCNTKVEEGNNYCPECGTKVR